MVYLHGGPGGYSYDFAALAGPRLEPALRMVYFDQRGSGHSERPWTQAYSMDALVEDVEGLRRALGVPKIALLGHSFGVALALEYAARYPAHVSRMVLAGGLSDAAASGRSMCLRLAEVNPEAYARARAAAGSASSADPGACKVFEALSGADAQAFLQANMYPDARIQALRDSVKAASGLRHTGELSRALFAAGLTEWRFTAFDRLTMPVLVIAGQHDYQVGLEAPRELARSLPQGQLRVYERGGHHMYLDEPERFAREVIGFLRESPNQGVKR
ncbi:MAG TPA: alpha/beta fold hydrolase [Longimicrobiaceae bacterium]|nr:alpha/beta fold hydrolase [Longimicrobiaceae bacterium]